MKKQAKKKPYTKPEVTKHDQLSQMTFSSH